MATVVEVAVGRVFPQLLEWAHRGWALARILRVFLRSGHPFSHGVRWVYTLYPLPLNGNLDGGQTRKFLSRRSWCMTLLTPIPALTTELLLVSNPYPTTPAELSAWAFTVSHQMNFTKVRKTAFTTELRWTHGQPFACVVSLGHVACSGISAVTHFFHRWAPGLVRVGAIPRGSCYAHLGAAGARASGRAEARPHAQGSCLDVYIQNCLATWERLGIHTELFVYVGALSGPKKSGAFATPAADCLRDFWTFLSFFFSVEGMGRIEYSTLSIC